MKPELITMLKDGEVQVLLGNNIYHYIVDSAHHRALRLLFEKAPFKGLNFCKNMCSEWWKEEVL